MEIFRKIIQWFKNLFTSKKNSVIAKGNSRPKPIQELKKDRRTNKQKRDDFLKSKGYTVSVVPVRPFRSRVHISAYSAAIRKFSELKRKGKINIKSYKNKWGIPFYDLRKSLKEQLTSKAA